MSCLRVWLGGLPVGLVDSIGLLVELGVELNMGGVLTLVECSTWVNMGSVFAQHGVKFFRFKLNMVPSQKPHKICLLSEIRMSPETEKGIIRRSKKSSTR